MNPKYVGKRRFFYKGPTEFYAADYAEVEEIVLSGIEEDEEQELSDEDIKFAKEDQAYQDFKEAL